MVFEAAKDYILQRLKRELPSELSYHGLHHTLDVCQAVDEIAEGENVTGEKLVMLRTAAVYHDIGFVKEYKNNEEIASEIAGETLGSFHYNKGQIEIIKKIILSTRVPQCPLTHMEEILCDADLDYLGREDFFVIAETLKKEWLTHDLIRSEKEWPSIQVAFLQHHRYFTPTSRARREALKQDHIAKLKELLR